MYNKDMKDLWNYLKETNKPIVLYGMGDGADKIISVLNSKKIKISGVFASDNFVRNKTFGGFPVTNYKTAKATFPDMIVLLCFGTALPDVINNIKNIASECELYAPDVPVSGGPVFDADFYKENEDKINSARKVLADSVSIKTFDSIIEYKLSGDINKLFSCEIANEEIYDIFDVKGTKCFVDLGAYRGDTVIDFVNRVETYDRIIAAEPDEKTFAKLKKNTENLKNITLINAAVSDKTGVMYFDKKASRGSHLVKSESEKSIPTFSLDSLGLFGDNVYIKADIEGAEADFINGAKDTIKNLKPSIRIAAYHKSEDIFSIPLKVLAINPDYKVYLRHNPCLPAWDTDYFFL
ncbi:MAG: FkbM family methyltransferase [Clostridia bacterium]|nr:FkbM family methyltransferase [Clostridia bacterium]